MCDMKQCDEEPTWEVDLVDHSKPFFQSFRTVRLCTDHMDYLESVEHIEMTEARELV